MPPPFTPIEVWRGYGWDGLPYQHHPAIGLVGHHAVIEPRGDIGERMRLVDRIHRNQGTAGFLYTDGGCDGGTAGGRGPFIGGHTLGWNDTCLAYVWLTDGRYHPLTYPEIEAFRYQRAWWVANGWLTPDHFMLPHGHMPGNATACCGPLIIDQWHELLLPYEGSFDAPAPEDTMDGLNTPLASIIIPAEGTGKVYATNWTTRWWIRSPEHWVWFAQRHLVPWIVGDDGNTWPRQAYEVGPEWLARLVDLDLDAAAWPTWVGAIAAGGGGGASTAEIAAAVKAVVERTTTTHVVS